MRRKNLKATYQFHNYCHYSPGNRRTYRFCLSTKSVSISHCWNRFLRYKDSKRIKIDHLSLQFIQPEHLKYCQLRRVAWQATELEITITLFMSVPSAYIRLVGKLQVLQANATGSAPLYLIHIYFINLINVYDGGIQLKTLSIVVHFLNALQRNF